MAGGGGAEGPCAWCRVPGAPAPANAQTIGTLRWQLAPYGSMMNITVTQQGGIFVCLPEEWRDPRPNRRSRLEERQAPARVDTRASPAATEIAAGRRYQAASGAPGQT